MNERLRLRGIFLAAAPIGEYDRRVVILTDKRGRISAFARGARRPKSQLVAAANPFASGYFYLYEGRDSYTLTGADVEEYHRELAGDLELVWYGYYFLEIAEYFSLENNDETERLSLLLESFSALEKKRIPIRLIRLVYEFRTLVLNGDVPNVFYCAGCNKKEGIKYFSMDKRSVVCEACKDKIQSMPIRSAALKAMQYICVSSSKDLFSFLLKEDVLGEFESLVRTYYKRYVEHSFKSEEFLDL